MGLLKDIRQQRAKQREKQPIEKDVFNRISTIVKRYGLRQSFMDAFDNIDAYLPKENLAANRVKVKTPLQNSLFSLVTEDEYALTMSIIRCVDNPYLKFATSPEEIVLCTPLYRLNHRLSAEKLMRYHFETLILHERAKIDINERTLQPE